MTLRDKRTILGVEPTTRGLAFAVFDDGQLLDWARSNRTKRHDDLALLDRLLRRYGVDLLVIEDPDSPGFRRGARAKKLLQNLSDHAMVRGVRFKSVARDVAREAWRASGSRTHEAIAAAVAEVFPPLLPLVPPPRKSFMPEDERVRIFGAVTLVLAATKSFPPRLAS